MYQNCVNYGAAGNVRKKTLLTLLLLHLSAILIISLHMSLTDLLLDSQYLMQTCMATAS